MNRERPKSHSEEPTWAGTATRQWASPHTTMLSTTRPLPVPTEMTGRWMLHGFHLYLRTVIVTGIAQTKNPGLRELR